MLAFAFALAFAFVFAVAFAFAFAFALPCFALLCPEIVNETMWLEKKHVRAKQYS